MQSQFQGERLLAQAAAPEHRTATLEHRSGDPAQQPPSHAPKSQSMWANGHEAPSGSRVGLHPPWTRPRLGGFRPLSRVLTAQMRSSAPAGQDQAPGVQTSQQDRSGSEWSPAHSGQRQASARSAISATEERGPGAAEWGSSRGEACKEGDLLASHRARHSAQVLAATLWLFCASLFLLSQISMLLSEML